MAALLAPFLASLVRTLLDDALIGYPFITFFPVVIVVAIIATPPAAVLAIVLSAALANRFAFDAAGNFMPQSTSAWIGVSLFLAISGVIIFLMSALSSTIVRLNSTAAALAQLNVDLETRVNARTDELSRANASLIREVVIREEAEAQMRQAQKIQAVGQLTGGIAHDFNNMLAIVISSLDIAKRRVAHGGIDVVKFLDNAMDGAQRAAVLTRRLLAFSRQQPLSPIVIDPNGLVRGMEELLRRTLEERIDFECVLAGGLWRTKIDPGQLENAILNLAVNARDAMPEGGRLTIETMNARLDDAYSANHPEVIAGQYVVIAISDSGTGMSDDVIERAFDPFFTTKAVGSGTGLGLSQVHGFIKQSGGHVKIYSELGHGTTIKIYLRREHESLTNQRDGTSELEQVLPIGSSEEVVLVVEDDDFVRLATVSSLRELGYSVMHAASGPEALEMLEKLPKIALLFTDVVMPGMSGRQLAETILKQYGPVPIIYTTGYTSNAIVHNGIIDLGVELLEKPFTLDQLARKVRKAIEAI